MTDESDPSDPSTDDLCDPSADALDRTDRMDAPSPGDVPSVPVDGAIDAHVHLMPERLMAAIRRALHAEAGWEFDHPVDREAMEARLRAAGVDRYVALPYAHEPGIAADLNDWVLDRAADSEMAIPFATVHGDDDVETVVREAFEAGARGLKFQNPVQECLPADDRLAPAYELAAAYDRPVLLHAGKAPMFDESPYVGVERFREFVASYPEVRVCAAHLGEPEQAAFFDLARTRENVFLDTAVALSPHTERLMGVDPATVSDETLVDLAGSVMYGSDYPNIPYPYADERAALLARDLPEGAVRQIFSRTARHFLGGSTD